MSRLANDLQTWPKEVEQRRVNAFVLKQRDRTVAGVAPEEAHAAAVRDVERLLKLEIERFDALDAGHTQPRPPTEIAVRDVIRFAVGLYRSGDFHTTKVF